MYVSAKTLKIYIKFADFKLNMRKSVVMTINKLYYLYIYAYYSIKTGFRPNSPPPLLCHSGQNRDNNGHICF